MEGKKKHNNDATKSQKNGASEDQSLKTEKNVRKLSMYRRNCGNIKENAASSEKRNSNRNCPQINN